MNSDQDCTFRPRLEALEDRFLLSGTVIYRFLVPPHLSRLPPAPVRPPIVGGNHTPAQVPTFIHPVGATTHSVSIVPQHISLGLFDKPSKVNVTGFNGGISNSGLRTPPVLASDAGFTAPGLIPFPLFQAATPSAPPTTGLTLSPQGLVSGRLF
jgi:hypothetical protein